MDPIIVKAYGLISYTKKRYITGQFLSFGFLIMFFVASFFYNLDDILLGNAKIIILIVLLLEAIETFFMLKKFKQKEALAKQD